MSTERNIHNGDHHSLLAQETTELDDIANMPEVVAPLSSHAAQQPDEAQLLEILENDFPKTFAFMDHEDFVTCARELYETHQSEETDLMSMGYLFPKFLAEHAQLKTSPEYGELAHLEFALSSAFDAPNAQVLTKTVSSRLRADDWAALHFKSHPSVTRLSFKTNAPEIWAALQKGELIESKSKALIVEIIVWRANNLARFRPMSYDEAMIWDEANKGANFSQLCEMLASYWPTEKAPLKASAYIQAWIAAEFLI